MINEQATRARNERNFVSVQNERSRIESYVERLTKRREQATKKNDWLTSVLYKHRLAKYYWELTVTSQRSAVFRLQRAMVWIKL